MINDIQRPVAPSVSLGSHAAAAQASVVAVPSVAQAAPQVPTKPQLQVNTEEMARNLRNAIDQINTVLRDGGRGLNFVMDDTVSGPIIQVRREETGEVIRQIPNEVVVRVAHNIEKLKGFLFSSAA
jgi:flagellar protein FlaG